MQNPHLKTDTRLLTKRSTLCELTGGGAAGVAGPTGTAAAGPWSPSTTSLTSSVWASALATMNRRHCSRCAEEKQLNSSLGDTQYRRAQNSSHSTLHAPTTQGGCCTA